MVRGKSATVKEREEYIVELLKANHGETVSGKAFDRDLGISPALRVNTICHLKKQHPQIKNLAKGGDAMYAWVEPEVAEKPAEAPKEEFKSLSQKTLSKIQPGEVWAAVESNGSRRLIYILNTLNERAQCINLYTESSTKVGLIGKDYFQIRVSNRSYIGVPASITSKPLKYLTNKEADADGVKLAEVRRMLSKVFGIPETREVKVEVPVEKEVVKEVPVEVEKIVYKDKEPEEVKIPNDYVDCKTARIAILTEERDIWKTVALKLLDKGGEAD